MSLSPLAALPQEIRELTHEYEEGTFRLSGNSMKIVVEGYGPFCQELGPYILNPGIWKITKGPYKYDSRDTFFAIIIHPYSFNLAHLPVVNINIYDNIGFVVTSLNIVDVGRNSSKPIISIEINKEEKDERGNLTSIAHLRKVFKVGDAYVLLLDKSGKKEKAVESAIIKYLFNKEVEYKYPSRMSDLPIEKSMKIMETLDKRYGKNWVSGSGLSSLYESIMSDERFIPGGDSVIDIISPNSYNITKLF